MRGPVEQFAEIPVPKKKPDIDTGEVSLPDFESALTELEQLVERLERGDQSLDASLRDFERGVALARACQHSLKTAEQRVEKLVEKDGELATEPFTAED